MTPKDIWTTLAVRLYLLIGAFVKVFRFACPMLSPYESTESKRAEDKPTKKAKKLTGLVPLAFGVTRVSRRSRTIEPHMLSWKQHGETLCCVRCGTNSSQKSSISTFTFLKKTQNVLRAWINFVKTSRKTFQCRQATTWSVLCISPRAVSTISLLLIWELRLGISGDSWTKMQCRLFWLKSVELLRNLSAAVKSSTDLKLTETPRGNWA